MHNFLKVLLLGFFVSAILYQIAIQGNITELGTVIKNVTFWRPEILKYPKDLINVPLPVMNYTSDVMVPVVSSFMLTMLQPAHRSGWLDKITCLNEAKTGSDNFLDKL